MLNDLFAIEKGLKAHGADLAGRHPDIKDMAKGWALRVRLSPEARIASVEIVQEAGRGAVWTLRDGQHNGFPGLKTAFGLLSLDDAALEAHSKAWEADKTIAGRRGELLRLLAAFSFDGSQISRWLNSGHRKRIRERLDTLRVLAVDPLTAAVPAAFERFLVALDATPSFLEDLVDRLADCLRNGGDQWLDPVRAALLGQIALLIDAADCEFQRDAGDLRQIGPVSAALSDSINPEGEEARGSSTCALTGSDETLHRGNFPQPNLPGLGQTYIYSRNRDIPSLTRYGRTADASFPIGAGLVRRLSDAIVSLTAEEAKGRTWRLIPAETGDKPDLLVTYLPSTPDINLAEALVEDEEDFASPESQLHESGSRIFKQLHGHGEQAEPEGQAIILVLRTVDPANRKAIYHRNTTAGLIWQADKHWQAAVTNTPHWLGFSVPVKGKRETAFRRPGHVAPLSLTALSRMQFVNGGRRRVNVIGITTAAAFELFLREGDVSGRANGLLRMLMQRHGPLLGGIAAARAKGIDHLKDFDPKADLRRDALRTMTWLGALLYDLGRCSCRNHDMPDTTPYTDELAFRLGQFLAAADLIHIGYCFDLRGGDVPPTLLGNSVLAVAGSDPTRALSILHSRLKPYLGWAKRAEPIYAKAKEEEGRGNKSRAIALRRGVSQARRADGLATDMHAMLGPYKTGTRKPDDAFRAELLLGYLAGLPRKETTPGDVAVEEETDKEDEGEGS